MLVDRHLDLAGLRREIHHEMCEQIDDSHDLKALRLVSHYFCWVSGLVLFRTIRLYPLLSCWATLNTLAMSRLSDYVECIEIANTMSTGECPNIESWQSRTDPSWPELFEHLKSHPRHGIQSTLQNSFDVLAVSPSPEDCCSCTQRWRHNAQEFLDFLQAGTAPPLHLQLLTKLSKVDTVSDKDLGAVEFKDQNGQYRYRDRRCLETRYQQYSYTSNTHLKSMMIAIKHTHITLTPLSLQSTAEICRPPFGVSNSATMAEGQLPHLLYLFITSPSPGPPQSPLDLPKPNIVASMGTTSALVMVVQSKQSPYVRGHREPRRRVGILSI